MTPATAALTFTQGPDDIQDPPYGHQEIRIEAVDAGAGPFLVISTERWSINPEDLDTFVSVLRHVLSLVEPQEGAQG